MPGTAGIGAVLCHIPIFAAVYESRQIRCAPFYVRSRNRGGRKPCLRSTTWRMLGGG